MWWEMHNRMIQTWRVMNLPALIKSNRENTAPNKKKHMRFDNEAMASFKKMQCPSKRSTAVPWINNDFSARFLCWIFRMKVHNYEQRKRMTCTSTVNRTCRWGYNVKNWKPSHSSNKQNFHCWLQVGILLNYKRHKLRYVWCYTHDTVLIMTWMLSHSHCCSSSDEIL